MSICVCAQISMRVRESRSVTGKPSPAVRSISKPRSRGIPHYITSSPAGNPRIPAIIPRGGNPCRPLVFIINLNDSRHVYQNLNNSKYAFVINLSAASPINTNLKGSRKLKKCN